MYLHFYYGVLQTLNVMNWVKGQNNRVKGELIELKPSKKTVRKLETLYILVICYKGED